MTEAPGLIAAHSIACHCREQRGWCITLSPFLIVDMPRMLRLAAHVAQLVGSPPEFCHTDIAVPTRNGASLSGADAMAIC